MADRYVKNDFTDIAPESDVADVEVDQGTSAVAKLTVEAIKGECPPKGSEFAVVYNFRIASVRNTLDILGIAIPDRRDPGVCKAALAQYYQALYASRTEATQAQGGTEGADGTRRRFKLCPLGTRHRMELPRTNQKRPLKKKERPFLAIR